MKCIYITYVLAVLWLGLHDVLPAGVANETTYEYKDMGAYAHPTENACMSDPALGFVVYVVFRDLSEEDFKGQWDAGTYTITLWDDPDKITIDTIAHEVHHLTATVMKDYALLDTHYAAYLQGNFTDCVYQIALRYAQSTPVDRDAGVVY